MYLIKACALIFGSLMLAGPILAKEASGLSVAVFPFKVLNKDPRAAHLGEGASEHIITHLVQSGAVEIIEESQLDKALRRLAKGQSGLYEEKNALALGRMVNARYVIIGTVQVFGLQCAINARLLEVETSKLIIAESIHGRINDIFGLYEKLSIRIKESLVNHLSLLVTSSAVARRGGGTNTVSVFEILARGEKLDPTYGGKDIKGATQLYRQAVLRDPKNGTARRRLGAAFIAMERYDEARYNIKKAIEVEPSHAWAQAYLGYCEHKLGDEGAAIVAYNKALQIKPSDVQARTWLAGSLLKLGQASDARDEFKKVLARDPSNKLALRGLRFSEQALSRASSSP